MFGYRVIFCLSIISWFLFGYFGGRINRIWRWIGGRGEGEDGLRVFVFGNLMEGGDIEVKIVSESGFREII